ncbi:MAG TPA: menaquinone biosynthesis decarboxylase, partial [Thermodesulfobacteriota bacterium]|nr:menaquinone biosynthesis decarboxylase [Thermodesulfobacteriota bacterium]
FIRHLESIGDLKRIKAEVDPILEITEVYSRVIKEEGPALIFENVKGSPFPLAINLFGTEGRVELALGRKPREVGEELVYLFEKMNPPSLKNFFSVLPKAFGLLSMRAKNVGKGIVQEIQEAPDLDRLPIIKCWPKDGGRFITLGLVLTQDPVTRRRNLGIYRMQIYDKKTTGMHWHPHKGGAAHYYEARKLGRDLEVAVVLGGDPKMIFTSIAPLPEGMDELAFASYLRGSPIPMVQGKSISLRVPANAEFIVEGVVPQGEIRVEGPFGDHFGHYSMEADFPVFHVREITHRKNAIYPATVVGKPPKEDIFLGIASAEMFSPLIKIIQPEVKRMWAYPEAGFHNLLVVSVDERYPKNGIKAMLALWGTGQLLLTKCMIMVSSDVNPRDWSAVLREIGENFDPREDFLLIPWAPLDTLDFTSGKLNVGSKMGINAVRRANGRPKRRFPEKVPDPREKLDEVTDYRLLPGGFLVIKVGTNPKENIRRLFDIPGYEDVRIIVTQSADIDIHDDTELIWGIFTRFDPYLDVIFEQTELRGSAVVYGGRMGIDATFKEWYPEVIEMSEDIKQKVTERWKEYWKE